MTALAKVRAVVCYVQYPREAAVDQQVQATPFRL